MGFELGNIVFISILVCKYFSQSYEQSFYRTLLSVLSNFFSVHKLLLLEEKNRGLPTLQEELPVNLDYDVVRPPIRGLLLITLIYIQVYCLI